MLPRGVWKSRTPVGAKHERPAYAISQSRVLSSSHTVTAASAGSNSLSVDLEKVHRDCQTTKYRDDDGNPVTSLLLLRHACEFDVELQLRTRVDDPPLITATRSGSRQPAAGWTFTAVVSPLS